MRNYLFALAFAAWWMPCSVVAAPRKAVATTAARIFNVRDFGAKADGQSDAAPALRAALAASQAAIEKGAARAVIFVPRGRYALQSADDGGHFFRWNDLKNIEVRGEKGTLFIAKKMDRGLFRLNRCENLTFSNFALDYDPLPFTQGVVTSVDKDKNSFTWKVDAGYHDPMSAAFRPFYTALDYRFYDRNGQLDLQAPLKIGTTLARSENGEILSDLNISAQGGVQPLRVGHRVALCTRYLVGAFYIENCRAIAMQNLEVRTGAGVFVLQVNCDSTSAKNVVVAPPRGSGRLQSTTADAFHSRGGRIGPRIENCRFEAQGDDDVNINAIPNDVLRVLSAREIIVPETPWNHPRQWRLGDTLELYRASDGALATRAKITDLQDATQPNGLQAWRATFDVPMKDEFTALSLDTTQPAQRLLAVNANLCGNGFVVRGNVFRNHRARGILARSRNGIIENNIVEHTEGGVYLGIELYWPEAPVSRNITVRGNTFRDLGRMTLGAIEIVDRAFAPTSGQENADIRIENNTVLDSAHPAVKVDNATRVHIHGNKVRPSKERRAKPGYKLSDEFVIDANTSAIEVRENVLLPSR